LAPKKPLIPHEAVTRERLFEGHAGRIVPESFGEVNHEGLAAHCIASGERGQFEAFV
jgi:hypothetical protein